MIGVLIICFIYQELRKLFASTFIGQLLLLIKYEDRSDSERNYIAEIIITEELRKSMPHGQ